MDRSRVEIGRVVGAHALRGEVRVRYFGDGPDTLLEIERVWLADTRDAATAKPYTVTGRGTGRAGEVRLALQGVGDRDAAIALRGQVVLVAADELEPLGDDDFYWHELIGCTVATQAGEEIGVVRELWDTGRHDVLVVEGGSGRQVLIPTARQIMTGVDRVARRIVIDPIPGLIDEPGEPGAGDPA